MNLNFIMNVGIFIIAIGGVFYSVVTRLNHIKHLNETIDDLKSEFIKYKDSMTIKIDNLIHDVTQIQSKCEERHK